MAKDPKIDDSELEEVAGGSRISQLGAILPHTPPPSTSDSSISKFDKADGGEEPYDTTPDLPGGPADT